MLWIKLIGFLILSYLLVVWITRHLVTIVFNKVDLSSYHQKNSKESN